MTSPVRATSFSGSSVSQSSARTAAASFPPSSTLIVTSTAGAICDTISWSEAIDLCSLRILRGRAAHRVHRTGSARRLKHVSPAAEAIRSLLASAGSDGPESLFELESIRVRHRCIETSAGDDHVLSEHENREKPNAKASNRLEPLREKAGNSCRNKPLRQKERPKSSKGPVSTRGDMPMPLSSNSSQSVSAVRRSRTVMFPAFGGRSHKVNRARTASAAF